MGVKVNKRLFLIICLVFVVSACNSKSDSAVSAVSIDTTNNGVIEFKFVEDYTTGQFANGDYWVHHDGGDVVISSILPASIRLGGRVYNGTMVNPDVSTEQGYDSHPRDMVYNPDLNVDPGITGSELVVPPGSSVIKSISMVSDEGRPIISHATVLTVLSETPPDGSFRPPYAGSDKTIPANIADLDYSILGHHTRLGNEPDISEVAGYYERVWLEHCTEWSQRDIHPSNNMPVYGRDIARTSAAGLILLQLDYTDEEKETLLIRLVQYGLDIYSIARLGGEWYNNGGHNLGRKMPLLLAGKVLNNADILAYADKEQHFIFQDDQQHFYVTQDEVDLSHSAAWDPDDRAELVPYEVSDIGMAEWGIRHSDRPESDNKSWDATYRHTNGPSQTMQVLAAHLMGVEADWNWPPLFDYIDRYYSIEQPDAFSDYVVELWEAYR